MRKLYKFNKTLDLCNALVSLLKKVVLFYYSSESCFPHSNKNAAMRYIQQKTPKQPLFH